MKPMKPITLQLLKDLDACQSQVDLFEKTFGQEVTPTLALCIQYADKFDMKWLGYTLYGWSFAKLSRRSAVNLTALEYEVQSWKRSYPVSTEQANSYYEMFMYNADLQRKMYLREIAILFFDTYYKSNRTFLQRLCDLITFKTK